MIKKSYTRLNENTSSFANLSAAFNVTFFLFLAWDVIYTSRAYATMSVSVCLSVCDGSALAHYI